MAATGGGKKGKKKKGKTLNLNEFLGQDTDKAPLRKINWGDEIEDSGPVNIPEEYGGPPKPQVDLAKLPSAPRSSRGVDIDFSRLPSQPPYTAFLGNLPFDVTEEEIRILFRGLRVENIRFPQDQGRFKGFGYAEFFDVEQLKIALALTNERIRNRTVRVDIADQSGRDSSGGGNNRGEGGRYADRADDNTADDWRRDDDMTATVGDDRRDNRNFRGDMRGGDVADRERITENTAADMDDAWRKDGPSTNGGFRNDRGGGFHNDREGGFRNDRGGGFRNDRDGGFRNDRDGGFRNDRGGGFRNDRDGGFRNDRDGGFRNDRDGGFRNDRDGGFRDDRGGGFRNDRGGGFRNDRDGGFRNDRDGGFRNDRDGGFRNDRDGGFRDDRGGGFRNDRGGGFRDNRVSHDDPTEGMWERGPPRVERGPARVDRGPTNDARTTDIERKPHVSDSKTSIFGSARPVDTASKEKEIQEKLESGKTVARGRGDERRAPGNDKGGDRGQYTSPNRDKYRSPNPDKDYGSPGRVKDRYFEENDEVDNWRDEKLRHDNPRVLKPVDGANEFAGEGSEKDMSVLRKGRGDDNRGRGKGGKSTRDKKKKDGPLMPPKYEEPEKPVFIHNSKFAALGIEDDDEGNNSNSDVECS